MYRLLLLLCLVGCASACPDCPSATHRLPLTPQCAQCAHNDLIFILDQSQSILASNQFPTMVQFVVDVLSTMNATAGVQQTPYGAHLGMYGNHVGFVFFNNTITAHAPLWQFLNSQPQEALAAIKAWLSEPANAITGGLSNICLALQTALDDFTNYPRKQVPRTVVLMTDGAPNTVTGGCTVDSLTSISNQLKNDHNVQVLVVAVNGINGAPADFNYQALKAIASTIDVDNTPIPLLWDLSDNYNLSVPAVRDALTSNMGCCDCYADMDFILELSEATEGSNFNAAVTDVLAFATGADIGPVNSTKNAFALTLFAQDSQNAICPCGNGGCGTTDSVQCNDVACIQNYFNRTCPAAFGTPPYSGSCSLKGSLAAGHTSLIRGLSTSEILVKSCPRNYAPKVAVVLASGACETQADPSCAVPPAVNSIITKFQAAYPMRYIIGIGDSSHVNWPNLRKLAGTVDVNGLSGGLMNDNDGSRQAIASAMLSIPTKICRYISDQPGCKCADCGFSHTSSPYCNKNK